VIERVEPELDGGRHPIKRVVGDVIEVEADIFCDGHDKIAACIQYRAQDESAWREAPMALVDNDRWAGRFPVLRNRRYLEDEKRHLGKARELVEFVGLSKRRHTLARDLTYGEQKMLEIARALALEPRIILLDEPVAGMNPTETSFVMELVRKIQAQGMTVLIIEHDMKMVMGISERIYVLVHGELIAEGNPEEVRNNQQVIEAYLGGGRRAPAN